MKEIGMYIHIPFCVQKCFYCDFHSYSHREDQMGGYIQALIEEMKSWEEKLKDYKIKSIFIGGGTPTIIPIRQMDGVLKTIHTSFTLKDDIEFSIESNPGTLDDNKLSYYLKNNINRLSMGLQAWQDPILRGLGRIHSVEDFLRNYMLAREIGFDNINIDLMFGLPNQTMSQWQQTLVNVADLYPEHMSVYSLKIEEGTPFGKLYDKGALHLPNEEVDRQMYHFATSYLVKRGYTHYEISNFSKDSMGCIHNRIYWENKEYIGFGLGAHSYLDQVRFSNEVDLEGYMGKIKSNQRAVVFEEKNDVADEMAETMFLGLRMMEGIDFNHFRKRFGKSPIDIYDREIVKLQREGLIEVNHKNMRLTKKGIDLSNQVFMAFLPD